MRRRGDRMIVRMEATTAGDVREPEAQGTAKSSIMKRTNKAVVTRATAAAAAAAPSVNMKEMEKMETDNQVTKAVWGVE